MSSPVLSLLPSCCFAGGNDSDTLIVVPIAVAYDQYPQTCAHPKQNEPIFRIRMVGVRNQQCPLIQEDGLRLLKRDPVLSDVYCVFPGIPFDAKRTHNYNVMIRVFGGKLRLERPKD